LLSGVPAEIGAGFHLALPEHLRHPPRSFRTDEVGPGLITEIQSPGSGGNVWHFSSSMGLGYPPKYRRRLYSQFGALDIAAETLIDRTRQEASLSAAASVGADKRGRVQ
jgi:hypothetical protein